MAGDQQHHIAHRWTKYFKVKNNDFNGFVLKCEDADSIRYEYEIATTTKYKVDQAKRNFGKSGEFVPLNFCFIIS